MICIPSFNKDTHAFRQRKSALTASSSLTYASMPASSSLSSSDFRCRKACVSLLNEGMVRIDHQPKADLKSHPLKRQKNAPPCRCAANKTPSYATRWVASRAFTLPSSTLRMGGLQSGQTEIRLPKEKCWIISYGADAHSRVLPAVIHL